MLINITEEDFNIFGEDLAVFSVIFCPKENVFFMSEYWFLFDMKIMIKSFPQDLIVF